jgi:hypothetical protein
MEINIDKLTAIKKMIYTEGRLLERKLFQYYFENGTKESCIRALIAYQNDDGGFGNGIEPDLLNPSSSGIGAETALYIVDILENVETDIITNIARWLEKSVNQHGFIPNPPSDLMEYPHQAWWENPDNERVLSVSGMLMKFGVKEVSLDNRIDKFASQIQELSNIEFYSYPLFVYAVYNEGFKNREKIVRHYISGFSRFLEENANHYPLFSRYWYHAIPFLPDEIVNKCAEEFINNIQDDGAVINPYPQFPWWRPTFTLDGLIILKKFGKLSIYQ